MADWSRIFGTPSAIPLDQLFAGTTPAPLNPFNLGYPGSGAPGNPSDDTGLSPLDDWQKRGSETAASALSILYPKDGPLSAAANQLPSAGNGLQPIPPNRLWAGIQTAPLGLLDYPTTTGEAPSHPAGQPDGNDTELLARLIFAEAAHEYDRSGVYDAIAHTVLNRVGQPGFRSNLRDVTFMPKQFASVGGTLWNKAADPSTLEPENARAYARALSTANEVLSGRDANLTDPTHGATYFYSGKATQPPGGFFSDRIRSGVLARTEEYPPFVFWKDVRQGQR